MNSSKPNPPTVLFRRAAFAALAALGAATASAQNDSPRVNDLNVRVPGLSQDVPSAQESIGMRQSRALAATYRREHRVTDLYMSPGWLGIASALDTMAAMEKPGNVLAPKLVAAEVQSGYVGGDSMKMYQMRIRASVNSMDRIEAESVQFSGDTQAELRTAKAEVVARRGNLDRSIADAEQAGPNSPENTRARLADDYDRYSEAVARYERIASS